MARYVEPTREQQEGWAKWVASRPPAVREVANRFEPWSLYRLKTTNQRVTVVSFSEQPDGSVTLTVAVTGEFNAVLHDRAVFGIKPDDLEPCDLPGPEEPLGTVLSEAEVMANIDALRVMRRPDLWVLNEHGKAVRRH